MILIPLVTYLPNQYSSYFYIFIGWLLWDNCSVLMNSDIVSEHYGDIIRRLNILYRNLKLIIANQLHQYTSLKNKYIFRSTQRQKSVNKWRYNYYRDSKLNIFHTKKRTVIPDKLNKSILSRDMNFWYWFWFLVFSSFDFSNDF